MQDTIGQQEIHSRFFTNSSDIYSKNVEYHRMNDIMYDKL